MKIRRNGAAANSIFGTVPLVFGVPLEGSRREIRVRWGLLTINKDGVAGCSQLDDHVAHHQRLHRGFGVPQHGCVLCDYGA